MIKPLVSLVVLLAAPAALAHPHVFIDTGVEFRFDASGHLTELRISWSYDDFTSLAVLADRGLPIDASFTEGQSGQLSGFDMQWIEGFEGDSYLLVGGTPVALSGPQDWETRVENGLVTTVHSRRTPAPIDPAGQEVVVQVYDPTYYTSYTIAHVPVLTGRADCSAQVYGPDPDRADEILRQALAELSGFDMEDDFPPIGAEFAEDIRLSCPAR